MKDDLDFDIEITDQDAVLAASIAKRKLAPAPSVTIAFEKTPLADVADLIFRLTDVWVVVDQEVACEETATASLQDVTIRTALEKALAGTSARYEIWRGFVFVSSAKTPRKATPKPKLTKAAEDLIYKRITWAFDDSLWKVARFLTERTKAKFVAGEEVQAKTVALGFRDVPLGQVLDAICRTRGLVIEPSGEENVFRAAE